MWKPENYYKEETQFQLLTRLVGGESSPKVRPDQIFDKCHM